MLLIIAHITASRLAAVCLRTNVPILTAAPLIKGGSPPASSLEAMLANPFPPAQIHAPTVLSAKQMPQRATFEQNRGQVASADQFEARFFHQSRSRSEHGESGTSFAYRTV